MILNKLQENKALIILLIPIIAILLWTKTFFETPLITEISLENSSFFFKKIIVFLKKIFLFQFTNYIALILLIYQSFLIKKFNTDYQFIKTQTFLPSLIFILLSSSYIETQNFNEVLIGNIFFIYGIIQLFKTSKKYLILKSPFLANLYLGIASLFSPVFLFFIPLFFIGLILLRPFNWREWIINFLGLFIIYSFFFKIFLLNDNVIAFYQHFDILKNISFQLKLNEISILSIMFYMYILIILFLALLQLMSNFAKFKINERKYFLIFLISIIFSIFIFLHTNIFLYILPIIAIFSSYIIGNYFVSIQKTWLGNLMFSIVLLFLIFIQI